MCNDNPDARDAQDSSTLDASVEQMAGDGVSDGNGDTTDTDTDTDTDEAETRVWLVERTYGDDELNLIILVYATTDGRYYHRRERALTSFTGPERETKASLIVSHDDLGTVDDQVTQDRYASEATRVAARHDPDDTI
ncbi:uncharacterized protein Nmag_0559 [Natrialba magadii ATCC 43099]|uniref:DUF7967 domain-containing protein n=1 Tax=Natrialba magadii (strain ATCC 43099 / DSM 3394 / CCM 3739 / CIP 104546 / IAM 13178 / JCM 8861 / NBRC 102185 / NCIMB 2190 / MS3) TaxID=547559 RepID=D3SYN5_NATMM|nr:hypothetical protein [Natrialba magadii]ADD04146.1 uncharacterized protein Nmag_0559 [Natrialba magadii ATCC 43099]ELY32931.1 hypothetical protein C500_03204 [Natrialba magadii ATCC 43099]